MKEKWVPSTTGFQEALRGVQDVYTDTLHAELTKALEKQDNVLARLKQAEKGVVSSQTRVHKNITRSEASNLASEVEKLESALNTAEKALGEAVAAVRRIDAKLPPAEQLGAASTSTHYSGLYKLIGEKEREENSDVTPKAVKKSSSPISGDHSEDLPNSNSQGNSPSVSNATD